jgi:proprotein convertase subtilisin/kexin type 5
MFGLLTFTSTTSTSNSSFPYICDPGCTNCASNFPQTCLQCADGYYASLISNNIIQCFSCNDNCLTCSSSNPSYCYSCFSNAYLNTTSTASTCNTCNPINNCMTCNIVNNFTSCTSCPYGYYLTSVTINKSTINNYCTS